MTVLVICEKDLTMLYMYNSCKYTPVVLLGGGFLLSLALVAWCEGFGSAICESSPYPLPTITTSELGLSRKVTPPRGLKSNRGCSPSTLSEDLPLSRREFFRARRGLLSNGLSVLRLKHQCIR